jgi:hypothetical protein
VCQSTSSSCLKDDVIKNCRVHREEEEEDVTFGIEKTSGPEA